MAPLGSRVGPLLLAAGLSSAATLAMCIFYIPTLGPAGQLPGRATALFADAASPALPQSRINAISPAKDLEPRLLKATNNTWGYDGKCKYEFTENKGHDMLEIMECELSRGILRLFANPVSMIAAFIFNVFWHALHMYRKPGHHSMPTPLREVSLGIFIVNIFADPYIFEFMKQHRVILSSCTLFIEGTIFRLTDAYKTYKHHQLILAGEQEEKPILAVSESDLLAAALQEDESVKDPYDLSDVKILSKYQKMSLGFTSVFLLFVCQLALMSFYNYSLVKDRGSWSTSFSGLRWFVGMLVCNLAGDKELAYTFNIEFWLKLLGNSKEMKGVWAGAKGKRQEQGGKIFYLIPVSYKCEAILRMIMSMFVNTFCQRIVCCTAPILLAVVDDPQEFIKDSLSYLFITQFDDLNHSVSFLSDLKKRVFLDKQHLNWRNTLFGSGYIFEAEKESEAKIDAMEKKIQKFEKRIKDLEGR